MSKSEIVPRNKSSRSPAKRHCILTAARHVFLELGYAETTVDAVAEKAGVSKATIYSHFHSKRDLFVAIISSLCEETFSQIAVAEDYSDAREALLSLARKYLLVILSPTALAIHRVVMAEARHRPEIAGIYSAAGLGAARRCTEEMLVRLSSRKLLSIPEDQITLASNQFLALLRCEMRTFAILHLPSPNHELVTVVNSAVDMMIARWGDHDGEG